MEVEIERINSSRLKREESKVEMQSLVSDMQAQSNRDELGISIKNTEELDNFLETQRRSQHGANNSSKIISSRPIMSNKYMHSNTLNNEINPKPKV